jgi:hypothetical protein
MTRAVALERARGQATTADHSVKGQTHQSVPAPDSAGSDIDTPDGQNPDPEVAPFGTGWLVLAPTGNLHLLPAATFYFPAHVAPDWQKALEAMTPGGPGTAGRAQRPGYLAPYLPFPLDRAHHALLLDACFTHLFSFGRNSYRDKFEAEMEQDPMQRGHYFSPVLHLAVLAIGWRYVSEQEVLRTYYAESSIEHRGQAFIDKALSFVTDDMADPRLSTVIGLIALSEYHTGMLQE